MVDDRKTVFISYANTDRSFVDRLSADLEKFGIDIWLDRKDIMAGSLWSSRIADALKEASALLVIVSSASVKSAWV